MKRSYPEITERSHDEHEATKENCSQTQHPQRQSMCHQSPSSQLSQSSSSSTDTFIARGIRQTPGQSNSADFPLLNSTINRTSHRTPGEDPGRSQSGRAIQHDPQICQIQDHEPGTVDTIDHPVCKEEDISDYDIFHSLSWEMIKIKKKRNVRNSSPWCSICRDVEKWMIQGNGMDKFRIGTVEDLQARAGCPSCDDVSSILSAESVPTIMPMYWFCTRNDIPKYVRSSYELVEGVTFCTYVFLNPLDRIFYTGEMGTAIDPDWFDIARLRKWLAYCDENHGEECHGLPVRGEFGSLRPRYLIDVTQGCLVESCGDERYFALSYVWGTQQEAGMATKGNINSLMQKGTITAQNATFRVPRTVEDAMKLTELLGERFLWVDRLCIVQDDLANWHSQIKKMGSIYANAYCTFVASAGSDADHGIAGLRQHSGPRHVLQRRIRFPSFQMIEMGFLDPTSTSTWNKRGWTFQELKLSRRALFFNNDVRWICHQSEWQEDTASEPEGIETGIMLWPGRYLALLSVAPWPDIAQWWDLILDYSKRLFCFETDAGAAFAGIEEILGHSFPGGFCFGIPEFYFDIALLWTPCKPMQRRSSKSDGSYLPSWSFLGWKGGALSPWGPTFAYEWLATLHEDEIWNTSSIVPKVDWIQKGPCGRERRIKNDYHIWKRSQDQLPPEAHAKLGWRRESNDNGWTHASIPNVCFRYPVPLGFQTVTDEYRTWPASLRLRSRSTFLTTNDSLNLSHSSKDFLYTDLVTRTGEWAGILHLNKPEDKPLGEVCELVALSCGSVSNNDEKGLGGMGLYEWDFYRRPKTTEVYEFYNVMWIRREEGYVLREAIGRVEKSIWDSQDLQEIDVELR